MTEPITKPTLSCADCKVTNCASRKGEFPAFCLTTELGEDTAKEILEVYRDPVDEKIAIEAARVERDFYQIATRVEETLVFIQRMGYTKVGVATCVGLLNETSILAQAARAKGIDLYAVACKVGGIDKTEIGLSEYDKHNPNNYEAMCNPILQAEALNRAGSQFNIVMGLCLGHDTLFIRHSQAPVTVLVVKDRVLCHNTAAALYGATGFYRRLLTPDLPAPRPRLGDD